jgi:hypothetical protein
VGFREERGRCSPANQHETKQIHRESLTTRLDDNGHVHLKSEKKAATRPVLPWPSGGLAVHRRGSSGVDNKFFRTRVVNKLLEDKGRGGYVRRHSCF